MNDIPRGTAKMTIINSLLAPDIMLGTLPVTHAHVQFGIRMSDSRLDDELSVATIEFSDTPKWLQLLNHDAYGIPKPTAHGTLWRGTDKNATDEHGRTEFTRGVRTGKTGMNFLYTEMLAEFPDTNVNIQDANGWTALHWACAGSPAELDMVRLCLQVPSCDIGLRDSDGLTAFDLALWRGDERIQVLFYQSMLDLEDSQPQGALLRILTMTSVETSQPVFPGEALFDPVANGNRPLVKALLAREVDLSVRNENGDTALHLAAVKPGNVEITSLLLDAGCDVNAVGNGGATPLHYAVHIAGDREVVQVLLDHNADVGLKAHDGRTALQLAEESPNQELVYLFKRLKPVDPESQVLTEQLEVVALVLKDTAGQDDEQQPAPQVLDIDAVLGPDTSLEGVTPFPEMEALNDVDESWELDSTALIRAAERGQIDTVRLLLSQGAHTETKGRGGRTALHFAASNGHPETVNVLLTARANLEAVDSFQQTALHLAVMNGQAAVVNSLLTAGADAEAVGNFNETALHIAARYGPTEVVNALLAAGAKVDAIEYSHCTALYIAVGNGQTEVVNALLGARANVEAVVDSYGTALQLAAQNGYTALVHSLLAAGAKVDVADNSHETALHLAARNGHTEVVNAILMFGCNVDAVNNCHETALHLAARNGCTELVNALLAAGAKVDFASNSHETPLHVAVQSRRTMVVNALLDAGANVEVVSDSEKTALDWAASMGQRDIVDALLEAGASITALDSINETALHSAVRHGDLPTVRALLAAGARIEARGDFGTVYQVASHFGQTEVCKLLQEYGTQTTSVGPSDSRLLSG